MVYPAVVIGRQTGKSQLSDILKNFYKTMAYTPVVKWQELPGLKLQAYVDDIQPRGFERGLREDDMDPVQAWCEQSNCGKRISFNIWQFKSRKHMTMFLIRWSS
jgi:hypothetical protein